MRKVEPNEMARLFDCKSEMLRTIVDIESLKALLEGALNWWLSYTMSQPVSFDLTILFFFLLEYIGATYFVTHIKTAIRSFVSLNTYQLDEHQAVCEDGSRQN